MKKSTYSFGEESPLKFEISSKMAKHYNEAVAEWFKAQQRFNQKFGRKWDPRADPIPIRWNRKHRKAWNDFAKIFNKVVKEQGPFHENDIMDDFLVKSSGTSIFSKTGPLIGSFASVDFVPSKKWGATITFVVAAGVLYGLLNRRNEYI